MLRIATRYHGRSSGHARDPQVQVRAPISADQQRIAEILTTVDEAIEQTEALIAKTQQIKAGLMHDLFTRGVTPDGQLRPPRSEAPQLYKESPLGWIPKEWDSRLLDDRGLEAAIIDGDRGERHPEHWTRRVGHRLSVRQT